MRIVTQVVWLAALLSMTVSIHAQEQSIAASRLNNEVLIWTANGVNADKLASELGITFVRPFASDPHAYVFSAQDVASASSIVKSLSNDGRFSSVMQNYRTGYVQQFTPNDPLYSDPTFGGQWHLNNSVSGRPHVNVVGAWNRNLTGAGVLLGIVDSGVQSTHEDIAPNFIVAHSYNFISGTPTITLTNGDRHGQSVAGVAAGRGGNGVGITGAAPLASIASLRVFGPDSTAGTAQMFADAVAYHSSGADTSIKVKNHSYSETDPYLVDLLHFNAVKASTMAGTIHVAAAGNFRGSIVGDSSRIQFQNMPEVITVAALNSNGVFSSYSNFGPCITVTAPSNGALGITTTDRVGNLGYNTSGSGNYSNLDYTNNFGGTSSASPLAAGVITLAKEANPNLDVRLAKHLLARTSTRVNLTDATATSDGGWRQNAAGIWFNQNYGFGLINADLLTAQAPLYAVTPETLTTSQLTTVATAIPDNSSTGITHTVTNTTPGLIEEVQVNLKITHLNRGDIEAFLTSPSGYTSRLTYRSTDTGDNIDWVFTTNAFWGEAALGTWQVNVRDVISNNTGTWDEYSISWHMGTIYSVPEPATWACSALGLGLGVFFYRRRQLKKKAAIESLIDTGDSQC